MSEISNILVYIYIGLHKQKRGEIRKLTHLLEVHVFSYFPDVFSAAFMVRLPNIQVRETETKTYIVCLV